MNMITFGRDGLRFGYRTVGVCVEGDWVLLHRADSGLRPLPQ